MPDETTDNTQPQASADGDGAQAPEATEPEPHPVIVALQQHCGGKFAAEGEDQCGTPIVRLGSERLVEVMTWLRDHDATGFDYLSSLTAVDWTVREPRFDVVYNLYSIPNNLRLTVKTGCAEDEGVPTMVDIWPAADWLERETYDLYGIEFLGHPDLRRIFLPEDWDGFPLRKDYPLEGPNLELLTRQQAAFRGGQFDRIRGEYELNEQEREMAAPGLVGALWTPEPDAADATETESDPQDTD